MSDTRWGRNGARQISFNGRMRFVGEGRSRQEDAETFCRPGWAQPKQTPSPFFSQPCRRLVAQVRSCSEGLRRSLRAIYDFLAVVSIKINYE